MPHKLIGTAVRLTRPVIVKASYHRVRAEDGKPEDVPAVIETEDTIAHVVGVEPRYDADNKPLCPKLHLSFLHPDRTHVLTGSGWREGYDRLLSVPPASDPAIMDGDEDHLAYYYSDDVAREMRAITDAMEAKDKAEAARLEAEAKVIAEAAAAKEPEPVGDHGLPGDKQPGIVTETKHYSDGSSATGPAPLPELSPEQQNAAENAALDADYPKCADGSLDR